MLNTGYCSSPIDVHVGERIRLRRTLLDMTQKHLAEALGLTFQQVQKYECGLNRVGASRLFEIARVLGIPINYLFDDMPKGMSETPVSGPRGRMSVTVEPDESRFNKASVEGKLSNATPVSLKHANGTK